MCKSALMHSRMLVTYFGHHRYGQLILWRCAIYVWLAICWIYTTNVISQLRVIVVCLCCMITSWYILFSINILLVLFGCLPTIMVCLLDMPGMWVAPLCGPKLMFLSRDSWSYKQGRWRYLGWRAQLRGKRLVSLLQIFTQGNSLVALSRCTVSWERRYEEVSLGCVVCRWSSICSVRFLYISTNNFT